MASVATTPVPTASNVGSALHVKSGVASRDKKLPVLNREIAGQVADREAVNIHANGVVIVGIRVLKNQDGVDKLVSTDLGATATDLLQRILI